MNKVNMILDIDNFNNSEDGDILVKEKNGLKVIAKDEYVKELKEQIERFDFKVDELKILINNYYSLLNKVLTQNENLKRALASALIEIDLISGEIDEVEDYEEEINKYIEKLGL